MDSTSVSLFRRLREPQPDAAWQRFVDLYGPLIFRWGCQKGLSATDAADLVQDVLATLLVKLPEFEYDPTRRFRGWLRTIVVNRACDLRRRNARLPANAADEVLAQLTVVEDVDLFLDAEYCRLLVHRALELLRSEFSSATWEAGRRQLLEGVRAGDAAQQLGLSLNAAYLAKSRLLSRLREELAGLME
ncbi:MAG: sigma-70 family RNA polymerase sigma factor [Planctomycetaceae bacterium]|nr:sigma-70 family RNA polymerase sigma factor [Planctomycetaceae bacterium]